MRRMIGLRRGVRVLILRGDSSASHKSARNHSVVCSKDGITNGPVNVRRRVRDPEYLCGIASRQSMEP